MATPARVVSALRSSPYIKIRFSASAIHSVRITHSGVSLLGLLRVAGEDDQTLLVCQEALDIEGLALCREVAPPVVDDDANTTGSLAADTSLLELAEREATAFTELAVVADGLGMDGGAEETQWADTKDGSLLLAGLAATELASGLVEPGADAQLPVLPEVVVVKDCTQISYLANNALE